MPAGKNALIRRSFISLALLGLIALFFGLNYLLFIPRQQRNYNKKVFRILHEAAEDFERGLKEDTTYYVKNLNKDTSSADRNIHYDTTRGFNESVNEGFNTHFGGLRDQAFKVTPGLRTLRFSH